MDKVFIARSRSPLPYCAYEIADLFYHEIQGFFAHSRIDPNPETVTHNFIRVLEFSNNSIIHPLLEAAETGMTGNIATEEISGLNIIAFQILNQIIAGKPGRPLDAKQKPKPVGIGAGSGPRKDEVIFEVLQAIVERIKILLAFLNKIRKLFNLGKANGCLHIAYF